MTREVDAGGTGDGASGPTTAYWLAVAVLVVSLLCGVSMARNSAWRSEAALLEDSILKIADKPRPYYNLGCVYSDLHRYSEAIAMFTRSIELYRLYNNADNERSRDFYFNVYHNRGLAYAGTGRLAEAIEDYTMVLLLKPDFADGYLERGDCYRELGAAHRACKDYENACDRGSEAGCEAARRNGLRRRAR